MRFGSNLLLLFNNATSYYKAILLSCAMKIQYGRVIRFTLLKSFSEAHTHRQSHNCWLSQNIQNTRRNGLQEEKISKKGETGGIEGKGKCFKEWSIKKGKRKRRSVYREGKRKEGMEGDMKIGWRVKERVWGRTVGKLWGHQWGWNKLQIIIKNNKGGMSENSHALAEETGWLHGIDG